MPVLLFLLPVLMLVCAAESALAQNGFFYHRQEWVVLRLQQDEGAPSPNDSSTAKTANKPEKQEEGSADEEGGEDKTTPSEELMDHPTLPNPERRKPSQNPSAALPSPAPSPARTLEEALYPYQLIHRMRVAEAGWPRPYVDGVQQPGQGDGITVYWRDSGGPLELELYAMEKDRRWLLIDPDMRLVQIINPNAHDADAILDIRTPVTAIMSIPETLYRRLPLKTGDRLMPSAKLDNQLKALQAGSISTLTESIESR